MIQTEKFILQTVMTYPELAHMLFDNIKDKELFTTPENQSIYQTMKDLFETGNSINTNWVRDALSGQIKNSYFNSLYESIRGTAPYQFPSCLRQSIEKLKWDRNKKRVLSKMNEVLESPVGNAEQLEELIKDLRVAERPRENPTFHEAYADYLEWINKRDTGITTGFVSLDRFTDSFNFGELVTIMARTTVGKTFWALNILQDLKPRVNYRIGFFSLEMPRAAVVERQQQIYFGLSRWEVKDKTQAKELYLDDFNKLYGDLLIYEKSYYPEDIEDIITKDGLQIVFIDFLDLLDTKVTGSPYHQTSDKILQLKRIAKEKNVLIILLHQLSREAGDGDIPVTLSMARDSGKIEEVSDFIYGLFRKRESNKDEDHLEWTNRICISLIKNKRGCPKKILCSFNKDSGKILEIQKETDKVETLNSSQPFN